MRVMLDSNIPDCLLKDDDTLKLVLSLCQRGDLTMCSTHIQHDQNSETPDLAKRAALLSLPIAYEQVNTAGAAWGVSKWDQADWGDETDDQIFAAVTSGQKVTEKQAADALIAATAARHCDALVTNDGRLASKARSADTGISVWQYPEFAEWVRCRSQRQGSKP